MRVGNYRCHPGDLRAAVKEYVDGVPGGVLSGDVAKKFNIVPSQAGSVLGRLYRAGLIERKFYGWNGYGAKVIYYPLGSCFKVFESVSSDDLGGLSEKVSSDNYLIGGDASSSSSSSSDSESDTDRRYRLSENHIRYLSDGLVGYDHD